MSDLLAPAQLFTKYMAVKDKIKELGIKEFSAGLVFVTPSQQSRRAMLWEQYRTDSAEIRHTFGDDKFQQDAVWLKYENDRMDLIIECLRENGWNIE